MSSLHNINIERAILSLIIFDPSTFEEIASILRPKDFYLPFHKYLFYAMEEIHKDDKPIDEEFLKQQLEKDNRWDEVEMLNVLSANPITDTLSYINQIKALSSKRALVTLATEIKKLTIEDELEVTDVMDSVEKKLYEITQESVSDDFRDSKEITISMLEGIKKVKELGNSGLIGVDTGFKNLNEKTSGFGKGDLIIIAARPAMGKTALVLNMTLKAIQRGEGVAFFSLEMPAEQLMLRMLSIKTSIPLQTLRIGNLDDTQWTQLSSAVDEVSSQKLFVDDGGYATIHHVRSKLRKLKSRRPEISMAIVDYLQLMSGDRGKEGRQQEISEISRGLKQLARELEIPIIALSQLNRGLESRENKRPMLSDLRESGCISGDTIVIDTKSGKEYRVEEIVKQKDKLLPMRVKAMDSDLKINEFDAINAFCSGVKTTYKLITKQGYTVRATANHKFYRVDGWQRLDSLRVGDKVATTITSSTITINITNIYWDEIVSIQKYQKEKVYDLTISRVHNFIANGIVLHNSIEQDADIVMFVYRDDVYREAKEKEKEMKAKAEGKEYRTTFRSKLEEETELIIGKQRNGPTGTVDLIFQKRFTRFIDATTTKMEIIYEHGGIKETKFEPLEDRGDNIDFPTSI